MCVCVNLIYDISSLHAYACAKSHSQAALCSNVLLSKWPLCYWYYFCCFYYNFSAVSVCFMFYVLSFRFCLFVCNLQLISYVCVCVCEDARARLSFTHRRIFFTDNLLSVYICVICCCSSILSTSNEFVSAANSLFVYQ